MCITGYLMTSNGKDSEKAKTAVAVLAGLASNQETPGELFGAVGDAAEEKTFGHKPGDYGLLTLSSPTSIVMFDEAEKHLMEAADALKELYEGMVPDFSSLESIEKSIKGLDGSLAKWQKIYGDDLIVQDTGADYVGAAAVAESCLAKRFKITKTEALGALRALTRMEFLERRVYLTNDDLPMGRLAIIDCVPQIATDPVFYFIYRIPKDRITNGSGIKHTAYAPRPKKAA